MMEANCKKRGDIPSWHWTDNGDRLSAPTNDLCILCTVWRCCWRKTRCEFVQQPLEKGRQWIPTQECLYNTFVGLSFEQKAFFSSTKWRVVEMLLQVSYRSHSDCLSKVNRGWRQQNAEAGVNCVRSSVSRLAAGGISTDVVNQLKKSLFRSMFPLPPGLTTHSKHRGATDNWRTGCMCTTSLR